MEVKDVGDRVRQRCNNEKSCTFIVTDKVLEKIPCESCEKELEVTYTCSNQERKFSNKCVKSFVEKCLVIPSYIRS